MKVTKTEYVRIMLEFFVSNEMDISIGDFAKYVNKAYRDYLINV